MKTKKLTKKLTLSKATIAMLDNKEKGNVKGGYLNTNFLDDCYTWDPVCPTLPQQTCRFQETQEFRTKEIEFSFLLFNLNLKFTAGDAESGRFSILVTFSTPGGEAFNPT